MISREALRDLLDTFIECHKPCPCTIGKQARLDEFVALWVERWDLTHCTCREFINRAHDLLEVD